MIVKITKTDIIYKHYTIAAANNYILVNYNIRNDGNFTTKRGQQLIMIDFEDLYEYYYNEDISREENEARAYTDKEIKQMAAEIAISNIYAFIKNENDISGINELIDYNNKNIDAFNKIKKY